MNRKVAVVGGAGNVGATVARGIAAKELADVVIIDIAEQKASGMALDMYEACPIEKSDARVIGGGDWAEASGADIVVITSGKPRKPGMSRDDLVRDNFAIMKSIAPNLVKHCPNAIVVPVANPLDAMAQALLKLSKFPRERVIGMAGVLDSARMRTFIAMELNVSVENVHAFVLGGHGDTMVPLARYSTVAGIPITELLSKDQIDETITMENVDTWDSLRHMEIMLAIEGKFGIQFEPDELVDMTTYSDIKKLVTDNFDLSPKGIREMLSLNKPIYESTAAYGHFGRKPGTNGSFSWEKTDKIAVFKR
mgnify:CR=1 FL=1